MKSPPKYEYLVKIDEIKNDPLFGELMGGVIHYLWKTKAPSALIMGLSNAVHGYAFNGESLADNLGLPSEKELKKLKKVIFNDLAIVEVVDEYSKKGFPLVTPDSDFDNVVSAFDKAAEHFRVSPTTIRDSYYKAIKILPKDKVPQKKLK